jgi:hypothetical protein
MHTHTYQRQTLRHDHPGGDRPHGYYGHEEDKGSPAYGEGTYEPGETRTTSLADALAEVDREKGGGFAADGTAKRRLVRTLFDLAEAVRAHQAAQPAAGADCVTRMEVTRTGARSERTRWFTLALLPGERAVLVVQNNYTGHAESYALPKGVRLVPVETGDATP